jgi:hypothetical protein
LGMSNRTMFNRMGQALNGQVVWFASKGANGYTLTDRESGRRHALFGQRRTVYTDRADPHPCHHTKITERWRGPRSSKFASRNRNWTGCLAVYAYFQNAAGGGIDIGL